MAGNESPRLVWILIRLAQNWAISKNRYDRYDKRQRRAGDSAEFDDSEGEARWAAYHDHPFPGFVGWVSQQNGEDQDAIRTAALKEFNGEPSLVAKLNALDEKGTTAELLEKLRGECPDIVKRLLANNSRSSTANGAELSAIADLLDRASNVFELARTLASELEQCHKSQGAIIVACEPSPRQRHAERIKEFVDAVLDLGGAVKNPPADFVAVADQIRRAGQIAKKLADTNSGDILGLFPDLKTIAEYGYQAVKSARNATQPDDPFAVFDDVPISAMAEQAATDATAGGDFIERLLAGPDDAELTPRELALLEAHLRARRTLHEMKRAAEPGSTEGRNRRKLELIRDFNRNLQAAASATVQSSPESLNDATDNKTTDAKPKRRGRRKADYATVKREAALAAEWEQARESGVYKSDFANDHGMTQAKLDALLDRVAKRKPPSE